MRRLLFAGVFACIFLFPAVSPAQAPVPDSSIRALAISNAVQYYQDFISFAAPLYSGPQYVEYYMQIQEGQPFFLNPSFQSGSIMYDQILYKKIALKYDQLEDKVVLEDPSGVFRLCPDTGKIDYFTINDHEFVKINKEGGPPSSPRTGFYEMLYGSNRVVLLKKETKKIVQDVYGKSTLQRYILTDVAYYVKKGDAYYSINKQKQALTIFKDRKNELRDYIRKNALDFRNDADNALLSVVSYYDGLKK